VTLALTALCVVTHGGLTLFVAAASAGLVATLLVSASMAGSIAPVRLRFDATLARLLIIAGLPIFMSDILGMVTLRLDTVMLSLLSLPTEVGYYGVANKLRDVAVKLPYLFAAFLMPVLVQCVRDPKLYDQRLADSLVSVWVFAVGIMLVLGCFAHAVVAFIAGHEFAAAVGCVRITGVALASGCLAAVLQYSAFARHKNAEVMRMHMISAGVALIGLFALIPSMGAVGAALAVAAGETVFAVCLLPLASPNGLAALPWLRLAGVGTVGLICAAIATGMHATGLPLYVSAPTVALSYAGLLLLTGMVRPENVALLLRKSPKTVPSQPDLP